HIDHPDHIDKYDHTDSSKDFNHLDDTTPAPFMLLFSTSLLVFGISGIVLYYLIGEIFRFSLFIITPIFTYTVTKLISVGWKKMAKSRYYVISSTSNQIGKEGEVILKVDKRGGVIKVPSQTPLKFEKIHVKPFRESDSFEEGTKVYICDIQDDYLLVDTDKSSIRRRK
ncbi:MAG: NfeD family protein, partial [Candidatus Hermodarchaeota archaeon]